jgi:hypothetical protein
LIDKEVDCPEGKALLFQMILSEILIKLMNITKEFKPLKPPIIMLKLVKIVKFTLR